jgi:signal transduction histidine kinase
MTSDLPARGHSLDRRLFDLAIALVLAAAVLVQVGLTSVEGPLLVNVLGALALTLPLIWRRRAPLAVALGYAAVTLLTAALGAGLHGGQIPLVAVILAGVVSFYSLGAYRGDRTALAGSVVGVLILWAAVVVGGNADPPSFGFSAALVVAAPCLAGRAQRLRDQREDALRELTVQMAREQEQRERLAVSDERARIARELHDVVAHSMSVMVVQAQGARRVLASEPDRARGALRSIEETGRTALAEVRRSLGVLRRDGAEPALEPQPSIEHLDVIVDQARRTGLTVDVTVEGERRPLAPGVDVSAYRIVQEALTNTIKHASATRARIAIRYGEHDLDMEVSDDGVGPSANGSGDEGGHGLVGMRERAALHGGELNAGAGPEGGFAVSARIPAEP